MVPSITGPSVMKENVDPVQKGGRAKEGKASDTKIKAPTSLKRRSSGAKPASDNSTKRQRGLLNNSEEEFSSSPLAIILDTLFEDRESSKLRVIYNTSTEAKRLRHARTEPMEEVCRFPEFRKRLTYGEVTNHSVVNDILPRLQLAKDDVFYDVGCGTGKVLFQATLHTGCTSKGIELAQPRVAIAQEAWNRLRCLEGKMSIPRKITEKIHIIQGDACSPPPEADLSDATVVFVNNVCFDAPLMRAILERVVEAKNLRMLITLRRICDRHRENVCRRNGSQCLTFVNPPEETIVKVTWTAESPVYFYRVAAPDVITE